MPHRFHSLYPGTTICKSRRRSNSRGSVRANEEIFISTFSNGICLSQSVRTAQVRWLGSRVVNREAKLNTERFTLWLAALHHRQRQEPLISTFYLSYTSVPPQKRHLYAQHGAFASMKKTRNCTTRTRGGCVTCKRRRKKCDERRPACGNCISSARKCEGFTDPFRNSSEVARRVLLTTIPTSLTDAEGCGPRVASFQHLAGAIFGHLDHFLVQEVLRRSSSEKMIRHALFALSVQLEAFACDHRNRLVRYANVEFSLRHYGQSLKSIQNALHDNMQVSQRLEILFALALVIGYEILRGNGPVALVHLRGALHLLSRSLMIRCPGSEDLALLENLELLYLQLEVGALSFAGALTPTISTTVFDHILKKANREISVSGTSVEVLLRAIRVKFICLKFRGLQALKQSGTAHHTRLLLLTELEGWFQIFCPILDSVSRSHRTSSSPSAQALKECRLLHIHYLVLTMRLSAFCPEPQETVFDSFEASFDVIVAHARTLIGQGQHLLFTLDMGLVEPLYMTVLKCREPRKRLTALELLSLCRQEGAWDGPLMACIAQHAIRVEAALCGHEQRGKVAPTSADVSFFDNAQTIWALRGDPDAEKCRVFAASLPSVNWEHRSTLVDFHHQRGKVQLVCTI
jgi:hypothetical protein